MIVALLLMVAMPMMAQRSAFNKVTPELQKEMNQGFEETFRVIIIMNEQFDTQKSTRQLQHLNKAQQREYVVNELQRVSQNGQKDVLKDLEQGQKASMVNDIKSFWIINAISAEMTEDMVWAIADRPDVKYVMKDVEIYIADGEENKTVLVGNNRATNQWNVTKVNADDVWSLGYTGGGVVVAVIDTGVNYNHTDIANNMWEGGSEYPSHGWDFVNSDNDPMDDHGHGTHCAGTVSSYGTNGNQCGIAKDAKIMALKALAANGSGSATSSWAAIEFAVSHGADILSMSLGSKGTGGNGTYRTVMENVLSCGVVASVSAGNVGDDLSTYPIPYNVGSPGNCPSPWRNPDQTLNGGRAAVVCVGSTTNTDDHSYFSSYGPSTWSSGSSISPYSDYPWEENSQTNIGLIKPDIAAPGSDILSLDHGSNTQYCTKSGTSMAAPCVAGVMALMLSVNPTLTPMEIDSIIETTAVACGGQTSKDNTFGAGRIDALAAINYMLNACNAPTNLTATLDRAVVSLSWTAASGVSTYRVYRNGIVIANNVSGTAYTDVSAPTGNNTYYVRSNGNNYQASIPSNQVTVTITTNAQTNAPTALTATNISNGSTTLTWTAPITRQADLYYANTHTSFIGTEAELIAGQKFTSDMLQPYAGMQINQVKFTGYSADAQYTIAIYEGDALLPGNLLHQATYTTTEQYEEITYTLPNPVAINPNKDLWLTITFSDAISYNNSIQSIGVNNAGLYRFASNDYWLTWNYSWAFVLSLSDGNFTYNIYNNDVAIATNQSNTNYTATYSNGMNLYQVTAVSNNYESDVSNSFMIVSEDATESNIALGSEDILVVLPNSTLTVNGTLSDFNEGNLILENGAELVHNTEDVQATVKKSITPPSVNDHGWYFIASPVTETVTPTADNGFLNGTYDLYYYDEPTHYWMNYESSDFSLLPQKGYLYANEATNGTTLQFTGTLTPSNNSVTINGLSHSASSLNGFNLVGNPFACNATVNKDFYIIDNTTNRVVLAEEGRQIAPGEGVFVKATDENDAVTFTKATTSAGPSSSSIDIVVTTNALATRDGSPTTLDRARVRLGDAETLEKFSFGDGEGSVIYFPQDDQDLAVACANGENEMPLNFKAAKNGIYTLAFEVEKLDLDYLHLIDNMTGDEIDVLAMPTYTFEAKTSDYASRFKLVFAEPTDGPSADDQPFAYYANGEIRIVADACDASLQVVDVTGRVIVSTDVARNVSTSGMPAGVYVLRLVSGDGVRTQKIVID